MIRYGLRNKNTGKIAGYHTNSNEGGEFCCSEQYLLDTTGDKMWLVDDAETAEYVRLNNTPWYNAGEETPTHPSNWKPEQWEVVSVEVIVKAEPVEVHLPTMEEYLALKYKEREPRHYKHCMELLRDPNRGEGFRYSLYELRTLRSEQR